MSSQTLNEEAILRKLIADGDGGSEDKRIILLFNFIRKLATPEVKSAKNKILATLDHVDLSIKKQCMVAEVLDQETKNNEELFVDIDNYIEKNMERIEEIKEELANAKLIRKNRQEYDILAKLIKEKPSRMESLNTLKKLQDELDEDNEKQKILEQKLAERRKNMYSLAILLNNLDDTLDAESTPPLNVVEGESTMEI